MKTILSKNLGQVVTAVALAVAGSSAFAGATWNSSSFSCGNVSSTSSYGNTASVNTGGCSGAAVVTASAWSSTADSSSSTTNDTFENAQLKIYSGGFGVSNRDEGLNASSDSHTIDNSAAVDLIALDFGSAKIKLTDVTVGWISGTNGHNDSDISVFAWTGVTTPTTIGAAIGGKTLANLASSGWTLVGSYSDLALNTPKAVNAGGTNSSWWLLSAYSRSYDNGSWTQTNDFFKIAAINGATVNPPPPSNGVPEPGSLALMGVAMMGFVASRRRKQQAA